MLICGVVELVDYPSLFPGLLLTLLSEAVLTQLTSGSQAGELLLEQNSISLSRERETEGLMLF